MILHRQITNGIVLYALCLAPSIGTAASDVISGDALFNKACASCHSMAQGEEKTGPSLYKIVGRRVASDPGYSYSPTLREDDKDWFKEVTSEIWTEEKLADYITNPKKEVPCRTYKKGRFLRCIDINMKFCGVESKEEVKSIVEFLKSKM